MGLMCHLSQVHRNSNISFVLAGGQEVQGNVNCRNSTGLGEGYDVSLFVTLQWDLENNMSGNWEELVLFLVIGITLVKHICMWCWKGIIGLKITDNKNTKF